MTYYLGIDAGGTATKARLTDASGKVLAKAKGGPANTRIGLDALHHQLLEICADVTNSAASCAITNAPAFVAASAEASR
jgi:glucosamine kinase